MKYLLSLSFLISISTLLAQQVNGEFNAGVPNTVTNTPPDSIVNFPDTEAEYPGGLDAMVEFIFLNFELPDGYLDTLSWNFNDDRVYLSFIVEKDGKISNINVEKGYNDIIDSVSIDVVQHMPNWTPAQKNGLPVRTLMRIPINIEEALIGPDLGLGEEDLVEEEMMEEEDDRKFSGGHFAGLDIYMSQFMNEQGDMNFDTHPYWENNEVKSIGLNYNVFDLKFPIMGSKLGITTGCGVGLQSFSLRNNYVLQHTADTIYAVSDTVFQFTINKLNVASISIPVLLDFNFNETFQKSYYMAVGVIGSYNYGARQRTTGSYTNGDQFDHSTISAFNMNRWTLDATVRMGYGHFGMHVSYQLNSFFKTGHTVAIYPFRVGFSLLFGV